MPDGQEWPDLTGLSEGVAFRICGFAVSNVV